MPALGLKLRLNRISARILQVITTGLVMWQKMNLTPWSGSSRLIDASGNANNATAFTGRGLSFDGVNDVITIGNTGNTVRSVVFLAYPDTTTQSFMQLTASGGVDVKITSGTLSGAGWTSPSYYVNGVASTTVAATTWQYIAVTSATAITASDVRLGLDNTTYYSGDLCNVKFFSVQLTAAQIAELYANPELAFPTGTSASDLVDWWPLAEGAAAGIALDGATVKNNGALSGPTNVLSLVNPCPQWAFKGNSWPMFFDDVNDYITLPSTTNAGTVHSFALFFISKSTYPGILIGSGLTEFIGIQNGSNVYDAGTNSVTFAGNFSVNVINHMVFSRNGTAVSLYINNVFISTQTLAGNEDFSFDRISVDSVIPFDGIIYNLGYWNSALSASEISSIYSAGINHDLRQSTGNYTSTANLKGYWVNTGNQASDWLDLSGNGNNGTVNGSPGRVFLPEGTAAGKDLVGMNLAHPVNQQFFSDGEGVIQINDSSSLDLSTAFTLEAWIKVTAEAGTSFIITKGNSYRLSINGLDRSITVRMVSSGVTTNLSSFANAWTFNNYHHIAATYNGSNLVIYVDGALNRSQSYTGTIDNVNTPISINAATSIDDGYLGNIRIYSAALTAAQVLNNYKAEKAAHS